MPDTLRPSAATMRSRVAIEIAAELVAAADQPYRQAKVLLRDQGAAPGSWPIALFGSSTVEGVKPSPARRPRWRWSIPRPC